MDTTMTNTELPPANSWSVEEATRYRDYFDALLTSDRDKLRASLEPIVSISDFDFGWLAFELYRSIQVGTSWHHLIPDWHKLDEDTRAKWTVSARLIAKSIDPVSASLIRQ